MEVCTYIWGRTTQVSIKERYISSIVESFQRLVYISKGENCMYISVLY